MAEEGKNKVAKSLLDMQPTAILELFRVFPDRINKPTLFLGFHGGANFNKSIVWQYELDEDSFVGLVEVGSFQRDDPRLEISSII